MADGRSKAKFSNLDVHEKIMKDVARHFKNAVGKEVAVDPVQARKCGERFEEVFRRLVAANTKYVGPSATPDGSGDDQPASDDEECLLREEYNTVVFPQMTAAVAEVVRKRKTYPPRYCRRLRERFYDQLGQMKAEAGAARMVKCGPPPDATRATEDLLMELARSSAADLASFKKTAVAAVKRAGALKVARELRKKASRSPPKVEKR